MLGCSDVASAHEASGEPTAQAIYLAKSKF